MENGLLDLEFLLLVHTKLIAKLAFCQMNKIEYLKEPIQGVIERDSML